MKNFSYKNEIFKTLVAASTGITTQLIGNRYAAKTMILVKGESTVFSNKNKYRTLEASTELSSS